MSLTVTWLGGVGMKASITVKDFLLIPAGGGWVLGAGAYTDINRAPGVIPI